MNYLFYSYRVYIDSFFLIRIVQPFFLAINDVLIYRAQINVAIDWLGQLPKNFVFFVWTDLNLNYLLIVYSEHTFFYGNYIFVPLFGFY